MANNDEVHKPNILVFAPERAGLNGPANRIEGRNFNVTFEPLSTSRRFDQYDGVVVFQRTFENLKYVSGQWASGWKQSVLLDDLDRRTKETQLLLDKGGFVCFILCHPLVDRDGRDSFETTDLVKRFLFGPSFYREDFGFRAVNVEATINEFERFLNLFGAAHTHFTYFTEATTSKDIRRLATASGHTVGMIFGSQVAFVPSMIPTWNEDVVPQYFDLLIDAVLATLKKLQVEVPEWARELQFEEEPALATKKRDLAEAMQNLDVRIEMLDRMKRVLVADGATLVEAVGFVLENGLGLQIEAVEDFKEDLRILTDDRSKVLMLCEVKGVNRGVKREHINQADNHRERANLPADFPTLLIVNTGIKSARSLAEKDQAIDPEQVRHAVRNHVLILRSLDLLYLAKLQAASDIKEQVRNLMLTNAGWLKVDSTGWSVETSSPASA